MRIVILTFSYFCSVLHDPIISIIVIHRCLYELVKVLTLIGSFLDGSWCLVVLIFRQTSVWRGTLTLMCCCTL